MESLIGIYKLTEQSKMELYRMIRERTSKGHNVNGEEEFAKEIRKNFSNASQKEKAE